MANIEFGSDINLWSNNFSQWTIEAIRFGKNR
jgi:hypothetical protein